jgi:hypothetical protein
MIHSSTGAAVVNENVWLNRTNTQVDEIAVLAHSSKLLTKKWLANSGIQDFDDPKYFTRRTARVDGIESLAALLTEQAARPRECLIRGRYLGDAVQLERNPDDFKPGKVLRRKTCFADQPMHAMLVDIDGYVPFEADPVVEPVASIEEYVLINLPAAFAGASYYWQLSSSAGHEKSRGVLKAHVWFWLQTPVTSAALRGWFSASRYVVDKSLFDEIQVHYTADPVFEDGVTDPVPVRHGFVRKDVQAVAIDVADVPVSEKPSAVQVAERALETDPTVLALRDAGMLKNGSTQKGGLYITCPFEARHTSASSDSSTVYFPAHTNHFVHGHFDCKHDHCAERTDREFRDKLGMPHDAEGDFVVEEPETDDSGAPVNSFQLASMRAREPVAPDLIKGVIPDAEFGIIYGKSGSGKSFAAIDLGYHLAQGAPWRGRKVKQRNVFYVAAEGAGGVRKRTQAYSEHHGLDASVPFYTRERGVNLYEKNGWTQAAADILAHTGEAPGVIFVDTLSRSIPGVDENSAKDMSLVIENCQKLGRATGCMVIVIAHAGKNDDQGVRGSSALRAAADFEIAVTRHLETQWRCLKLTKSKDDTDGKEFAFTLASVEVGEDTDGEPVFSAVAVPSDERPTVVKKPQGARRRRVFDAFLDLADFDEGGEVAIESVIDRALELNPDESKNARCNLRDTIREMCKGETAFFREITPGLISSIPQNSSDAF